MQRGKDEVRTVETGRLFANMADGLMRIFLQVSLVSEQGLARVAPDNSTIKDADAAAVAEALRSVKDLSSVSVRLLDSFLLAERLHMAGQPAEQQPFAVSGLLYDTAHLLEPYAKRLGVRLAVQTPRRAAPILSNQAVLAAALTCLGQVFVLAEAEREKPGTMLLAAHKNGHGLITGVYSDALAISPPMLRQAYRLHGRAHQPVAKLVSGPASGLFIARELLTTLAVRPHAARLKHTNGIAITLPVYRQTQLVTA